MCKSTLNDPFNNTSDIISTWQMRRWRLKEVRELAEGHSIWQLATRGLGPQPALLQHPGYEPVKGIHGSTLQNAQL